MYTKSTCLVCLVLALTFAPAATAVIRWTDENGIASNHNWSDAGNWDTGQVPEELDVAWINYSEYSSAPEAHGPIIDSNVGSVAHLKVGSLKADKPAVLTVEEDGVITIKKRAGRFPLNNGQMVVAQGEGASGTVVMNGGKIIVESMCQFGKRPGQGLLQMSGDGEFVVKGTLKLGGMKLGTGDARIQLDAGVVKCKGISIFDGEGKIDIAGGKLIAGPGRLDYHGYKGKKMKDYIKACIQKKYITAYGGKGKVQYKQDSPQPDWIEVWAVMPGEDANSTEAAAGEQKAEKDTTPDTTKQEK